MSNQENDKFYENVVEGMKGVGVSNQAKMIVAEIMDEDHELYDDGGHVRPEVLADMIDRAKDEAEDKLLEANLTDDDSDKDAPDASNNYPTNMDTSLLN